MSPNPFVRRSAGVAYCSSDPATRTTPMKSESSLSADEIRRFQRILYYIDASNPAYHAVRETGRIDTATRRALSAFRNIYSLDDETRIARGWAPNDLPIGSSLDPCAQIALNNFGVFASRPPIPGSPAQTVPGRTVIVDEVRNGENDHRPQIVLGDSPATGLPPRPADPPVITTPVTRTDPVTHDRITATVERNPATGGQSATITHTNPITGTVHTEIVHGEAAGIEYITTGKQPGEAAGWTTTQKAAAAVAVAGTIAAIAYTWRNHGPRRIRVHTLRGARI